MVWKPVVPSLAAIAVLACGCGTEEECDPAPAVLLHLSGDRTFEPGVPLVAHLVGKFDEVETFTCDITTAEDEAGRRTITGACAGAAELRVWPGDEGDEEDLYIQGSFRRLRVDKTWAVWPEASQTCGLKLDSDEYCSGDEVERDLGC